MVGTSDSEIWSGLEAGGGAALYIARGFEDHQEPDHVTTTSSVGVQYIEWPYPLN